MNKAREIVLVVLLIAIAAIPRFVGLGKFTSIDEPFWLRASGNFYYALGQRQFENTLYEYHPAVTTMWVIAAGMLAYFPEYRALEQGYLKPSKFDAFMVEHGKNMLQLLIDSRAVQVILVVVLLLVIYFLLRLLFGSWKAFFATAFLSLSPYFLGTSRLLNHEAMLGLFLMVALLSLLVYLYVERRLLFLLLSAAAAALAQLTKSSGIVLFPLIGLVILIAALHSIRSREKKPGPALLDAARTLGIWLAAMAAAYILFWPGMWVAPGKMLYEVYGNALTYAFQGKRLSTTAGVAPSGFRLAGVLFGVRVYLGDLVWRTTPLTWLGFVFGIVAALAKPARPQSETGKAYGLTVLYALILGLLFVLLFGAQHGTKPPHYILTAYLAVDLIAGLGWSRLIESLSRLRPQFQSAWLTTGIVTVVLALQLTSALGFYPYYITYYDPVLEALQPGIQNPTLRNTGYGVGLDQAAAYLDKKPGASGLTVMSANGLGSFSYYFSGRTVPMNELVLSDPQVVAYLKGTQYVVMDYYNQRRRQHMTGLAGIKPEKSIWLNGVEFLRIYRAADVLRRVPVAQP